MKDVDHGSLKAYITGFLACLFLVFLAYFLAVQKVLEGWTLNITLTVLALIQAAVQFILFLHLGTEAKPRSNLFVFMLMLLILSIVFFGSLWIMVSLNERVMPPMG